MKSQQIQNVSLNTFCGCLFIPRQPEKIGRRNIIAFCSDRQHKEIELRSTPKNYILQNVW